MDNPVFRCGHPRTPENSKSSPSSKNPRCRICYSARLKRWRLANTTGQPKGRPRAPIDIKPLGLTGEDSAYRDMVRRGTAMLGAAIERLLGRAA